MSHASPARNTGDAILGTPGHGLEGAVLTHQKRSVALRYWLLGAQMTTASRAMDFASSYHVGVRKDGRTPEFAHQVAIVSYLRTLMPHLLHPDATLATGFLHDVREDYDVSDEQIRARFGAQVADATDAMTKQFRGVTRDPAAVFDAIASDPIASIAKLADRINNLGSMVGVFTVDKAAAYVAETHELFLPMLRQARRAFPEQEGAYENAKLVLLTQITLVEHLTMRQQ